MQNPPLLPLYTVAYVSQKTSDVAGVLDGKLDEFIKAYLMEFGAEG